MKIRKILLLAAACGCVAQAVEPKPVAVNELAAQGIDKSSAIIISDRLRNELFNTGVFKVLERDQMENILKEQGFQQSGCTSDACAVEIGQLLGVQYLVVGSIGKIGQTYTINIRMIDVTSGQIVMTANTDCRCEIDQVLSKSTVDIAQRLAKSITGTSTDQTPQSVGQPSAGDKKAAGDEKPKRKRLSPLVKIGLSVAAAAAAGAGVYMNYLASQDVDACNKAKTDYLASGSNQEYQTFNKSYQDSRSSAEQKCTVRNVLYIASGALAVGFGITLAF